MKKRILYLLAFISLFLLVLNLFNSFLKEEEETISEMEYIDSDDFIFQGRVLKVEEMSVEIPEDWTEERKEKKISFSDKEEIPCEINIQAGKAKDADRPVIADYIEILIESAEEDMERRHEVFYLEKAKGLKTVFDLGEAKYIILEIPFEDKVYIIESGFILDKECERKIEGIMESVFLGVEK